jgi:hypothetical protein
MIFYGFPMVFRWSSDDFPWEIPRHWPLGGGWSPRSGRRALAGSPPSRALSRLKNGEATKMMRCIDDD